MAIQLAYLGYNITKDHHSHKVMVAEDKLCIGVSIIPITRGNFSYKARFLSYLRWPPHEREIFILSSLNLYCKSEYVSYYQMIITDP